MSNRVWKRCQKPNSASGVIFGHSRLLPGLLLVLLLFALEQRCRAELQSCDFLEFQAGTWQRSLTRAVVFPPPAPDDVLFIQDSIGVDVLHYSKDGPIKIPIFINRYFGDPEERARQIETGGIPRTVRLIMPAYDVDYVTGWPYHPERDYVYFNDQFIGILYGSNKTWKMNIFPIPIELVNFPDAMGDSAVNWVRIDVDVENSRPIWVTAIDWAALAIPAPRPVMLVHGWMSDSSTWRRMQNSIRKNTGVPTVAIDVNPTGALFDNAYTLKYELEEWRQRFAVQEFNIMAHSKGGLDSRCYTNSNTHSEYAHDVHQIFQIATPNAGSRMADLLYDYHHLTLGQQLFLSMFISANKLIKIGTWHITTEFTREFNRRSRQGRSRAGLSVVSGRVPNRPFWLFNFPFLDIAELAYGHDDNSADPHHWGDGVVSVASAHTFASPRSASPLRGTNCDHLDIISEQATKIVKIYHDDLLEQKKPTYQPENYHQLIDYRRSAAEQPQPLRSQNATVRDANTPFVLDLNADYPWKDVCTTWDGRLGPGESANCQFLLSQPQDISFLFLGLTPELPVTVSTPNGTQYSNQEENTFFGLPQVLNADESALPLAALVTDLGTLPLTAAEAGTYRINLGPNPKDEDIICQIAMQEKIPSLQFRLWPRSRTAKTGHDFVLFCSSKLHQELLSEQKMQVQLQVVQEKDGEYGRNYEGGVFRDDGAAPDQVAGDGVFTAAFTIPEAGNFVFFARAEIIPAPGLKAKASSFIMGNGSASASKISAVREFRSLDNNGNGLFDELQAFCELDIDTESRYYLCAELCDRNGQRVSTCNSPETTLASGRQEVILAFPGQEIFQRGLDGPYCISQLTLYEAGGNMLSSAELDTHSSQLESDEFRFLEFEHEPICLFGSGRDWAADQDRDGCQETIKVEIKVLVAPTYVKSYNWDASLFDAQGHKVADSRIYVQLTHTPESLGLNTLTFSFDTKDIVECRCNGPFRFGGIVVWSSSNLNCIYLESAYQTAAYRFREFMPMGNIIDVSDNIALTFNHWNLNPNSGALTATATLQNIAGKNGAPLEKAFWLVLPSGSHNRLCQVDGQTDTGLDYLDVTDAIEAELPQLGNRDLKLDPGEAVQFTIEVFSRDRSIPQAQIFSFWADPPPEPQIPAGTIPDATPLDDCALLLLLEKWHRDEITDAVLLQAIIQWQTPQ
jgi:hypothetical protein